MMEPETGFLDSLTHDFLVTATRLQCRLSVDLAFLCYIRRFARFGFFTLGPITIDVDLLEDLVERTMVPTGMTGLTEDYERFTRLLMAEVRRSGRKRIDERHYLLAFARCSEGLPARVFGELGVTAEQIEAYFREPAEVAASPDRLMTPEEVAAYLQVHVETVRGWIRTGKLPARRIAGLRALRVRAADVAELLKPLDAGDAG